MRNIPFTVIIIFILAGCSLFSADKKEPEDPFEAVFTAEINGAPFDGSPFKEYAQVIMTTQGEYSPQGEYSFLTIYASQFNEQLSPYHEKISINLLYEEGRQKYKTRVDSVMYDEENYMTDGGSYYEKDGDVTISTYKAFEDEEGFVTVEMEEQDNGETVVSGTFEMRVIVDYRDDPYSQRADQDTLYITNGEYRLLLDDRRDGQE
ncbi:MAG: hypothetical protein FH748_00185 [Balneolaceae bacterium]|nr:hypothetical protein [Balneolaceae bacterium]